MKIYFDTYPYLVPVTGARLRYDSWYGREMAVGTVAKDTGPYRKGEELTTHPRNAVRKTRTNSVGQILVATVSLEKITD